MTINYASYARNQAWLGKEFGLNFAIRQFGEEVVNNLPRFVKGKNKGNHKATIEWIKCEKGGWDGPRGRVERRVGQVIGARLVIIPYGGGEIEVLAENGDTSHFVR